MFDRYVFWKEKVQNVEKDGKVVGFTLKSLIPYYRGIPLSMVHDVKVVVDGKEIERGKIRFTPDGENWFTLDEMETVTTYKWEYGQEATIFVEKEGGLSKGAHEITLSVAVRTDYVPVPFGGTRTRTIHIA